MIFSPELAAKVMAGEKTLTRRPLSENPRSPWCRRRARALFGSTVAVQPGRGQKAIGRVLVTSVILLPLGSVGNGVDVEEEGFESIQDFIAYWTEMHGRFDPEELVWRIELARE